MKTTNALLSILTASIAAAGALDAAATRIAFVDPFATARGNAFTATADSPSAVFYNAAGLTQLEGTEFQANLYAISLGYEWDGPLGSADMDDKFQAVPSLFLAHRFEDSPFAIGFGVYAPFALGTDWGADAPFAFPGSPVPYEAELKYLKYHPVLAWQVTDTLSIAVGPTFDDSEIDIKTNAPLDFEGDDSAVGYSLAVRWQPSDEHAFGLNYQARTQMKFKGTADIGAPLAASAKVDFPESIVAGYSYRPNEDWNFEVNVDWTNWDRVNSLTLSGPMLDLVIPDPADRTYTLNWESAFIWEAGVTRYLDDGWHLSAGYTFVENAVPGADLLPIVPDSDRHFFGLGIGRDYERLSWMFTYQFTYAEERTASAANYGGIQAGDYDLESQALAFSLAYRF